MSTAASSTLDASGAGAASLSERRGQARRELRAWAALAIGSLALAGVFAFLLALSRIPGVQHVLPWAIGFFPKGLVIHVVFSLVVWFLATFALMASAATYEACDFEPSCASLGPAGAALLATSFPFLFEPAFLQDSIASLNNYVPVIVHRSYYFGLTLLALAIALPAARIIINVGGGRRLPADPFLLAMAAGAAIYFVALCCFAIALGFSWGLEPSRTFHEHLFWGGGHVLQFLYALLMLTGWFTLLRATLGEASFDADIFKLAVVLLALFTLPGPALYKVFAPFSVLQTEAFRRLQLVVALPSLIIAIGGLSAVLSARRQGPLPWSDPGFLALVLSALVFAAGGVMGLLITGSDTRTPAHYHGTIAGVNLALMGLYLKRLLPAVGRPIEPSRLVRAEIVLFGLGQLVACIGLFLAGGYGAPRKLPDGAAHLVNGAAVGMYLHGVGALIAIIGGVLFVATVSRALLTAERVPAAAPN